LALTVGPGNQFGGPASASAHLIGRKGSRDNKMASSIGDLPRSALLREARIIMAV